MGDGTGLALRTTLANFYPLVADMRMIAKDAGLSTGNIDLSGKPIVAWFNLLEYAEAQVKHDAVVARALLDYPENDVLRRASEHRPPPPLLEGPKAEWEGPAAPATLEKLMGYRSTLVNISYLERGLSRAGAVVRIQRQDGGSGTGFLLDGDILVTNNHVLPDLESARTAIAQFNYQLTIDGLNAPVETFNLAPNDFFRTNPDDDWTAVKVAGNPGSKWGSLKLAARTPDVGEHVNIIQHAGGGPKQVSLSANVVAFVGHGRVQYLTDTLPGSSGSPVFDADWNVIALHHSGGWITEPNAQSKSLFYRNEGIAIDRIIDGLAAG